MTTTPPIPIVARLREWIKPQTNANAGLNWDLEEAADTIEALLEALEHIRAYGRSALTGAHCVAIAEAAIAKARGQS
jgi:hypothetical protein